MTRSLSPQNARQFQDGLELEFAAITRCIKSGDLQGLMPKLAQLAQVVQPNKVQQITDCLLPRAIQQISTLISDRFDGNKARTSAQVKRIWRSLEPKRESYSAVVSFVAAQAEKGGVQIPEDIAIQSHIPLLVGPIEFVKPLARELKLLESRLEYSQAFSEYETGRKREIVAELTQLGVAAVLLGRAGVKGLSAQAICDTVMSNYGFAPVHVVSTKGEEESHFDWQKRQIIINSEEFEGLTNQLKVNLLLHEIRHAIQRNLIDNMLYARADGSPTFYSHRSVHKTVRTYQRDVECMLISSFASNISSELVTLTEAASQASYAALSRERDADQFAAHILALLLRKDPDSILAEYAETIKTERESVGESGGAGKASASKVVMELESSLVLPSSGNSWGARDLRDSTLAILSRLVAKPGVEESFEHLLFGEPNVPEEQNGADSQLISEQLKRDPERYTRFYRSLVFQARMAKFDSQKSIQNELPYLRNLAEHPLCGQNGLRILSERIREVLESSMKLNQKTRVSLHKLLASIEQRINQPVVKRETKTQVIRVLTSREPTVIPLTPKGAQETLLDSCARMLQQVKASTYVDCAHTLRIIDAHLQQGWLGGPQLQLAISLVQETEQALAHVEQHDIRDLLKVRLNQIGSALRTAYKS